VSAAGGPDSPPRDPGLQGERTALAWNRTALALFVNAALALRAGLSGDRTSLTVVGIALLLAAAACAGCGSWRRRALLRDPRATAPPAPAMLGVALAALLACIAAVASVIDATR
jgi:uncharacterized membrane protein YidH (DUF202 family)